MRIAVWHNLPSGGAKRALYDQVRVLKERGHYMEAWTTDYLSEDYLSLSSEIKEHCKPLVKEIDRINQFKSPLKRTKRTTELLKSHCKECVEEIESQKFDLIFANSCAISYMPFLGLFSKLPVIVFLGEPNRALYEANEAGNTWELPEYKLSPRGIYSYYKDLLRTYSRRIQVCEEIAASKSNTRILVNSLFSRESVKRAYGIESEVCYLGVDENHFLIDEKVGKQPFVVGMGRISRAKNIEAALTVISRIPENIRPALKWISNGYVPDYLERISRMAKELNVDFIPIIDIDDSTLIGTLNEASIMIYTSHLEPFGLAPVEANMCGTFVIAIAEGGVRESIQHGINGFLVNRNLPEEMAKLIIPFCTDPEYAARMGHQARVHAVKYWNRSMMGDNIEQALQSALK